MQFKIKSQRLAITCVLLSQEFIYVLFSVSTLVFSNMEFAKNVIPNLYTYVIKDV